MTGSREAIRGSVIPGWSEGPDLRCAIAHRGISRFSDAQLRIVVRCFASPRNDKGLIAVSRSLRCANAWRLSQAKRPELQKIKRPALNSNRALLVTCS